MVTKNIVIGLFIIGALIALPFLSSATKASIGASINIDEKLQKEIKRGLVKEYNVIVKKTGDSPVDVKPKVVDINEIVDISRNSQTEKIYLNSPVEVNLRRAVPRIDAVTYKSQGNGIKVCILDTGIDKSNSDLNNPLKEYDFFNKDNDASDDNGHGTHVAGIISSSDNTYKGVAPKVELLIGKVVGSDGRGSLSDVIEGIRWCTNNGADIISMSLSTDDDYKDACDRDLLAESSNWAVDQGVVVVASAGNKGRIGGGSPGCASKVISVGASSSSGRLYSFSSVTNEVDVLAPGYVTSTYLNNQFRSLRGTSMSAPLVSGSVAILKDIFPNKSNKKIKEALYDTARCYYSHHCIFGEGNGQIDVYDACLRLDGKEDLTQTESTSTISRRTTSVSSSRDYRSIGGTIGMHANEEFADCLEYKTDNYETSFSVKGASNEFFPATRYSRIYKSTRTPTKSRIVFHTREGYPVEITGSRGRYYYKVWFDTHVDRHSRDYAQYWRFYPRSYSEVKGELYVVKSCGQGNNPNKSEPEKSICDEIFKKQ